MPEIQNFLKPLPSASGNPSYGNRPDGSAKGEGWYGALPMLDKSGNVATELSTTFNYGKGDVLVPLINPMLTPAEHLSLLQGKEPTKEILDKAAQWGFERLQQNKSPFIMEGEQQKVPDEGLVNFIVNGK